MAVFSSLEPAIDPANRITFLIDWELTMKCNLDCSYCGSEGIYGGHNNSIKHPQIEDCVKTIDFMFSYVDLYMSQKIRGLKAAVLNVYGGEALYHPHILDILSKCQEYHQQRYADRWPLTVTITTNAVISRKKFDSIVSLVDEVTCSFHCEATDEQKSLFKKNVLAVKSQGKRVKVVVLMHTDPVYFAQSQDIIHWCQTHDIAHLPRQLDPTPQQTKREYQSQEVKWLTAFYKKNQHKSSYFPEVDNDATSQDLTNIGRACCGGRQLCLDSNFKSRNFVVKNQFHGWFCSVNEFFVYIKQVEKKIYTNKDCKMNFDGSIGPIGDLDHYQELLARTRQQIENKHMPVIRCAKSRCYCGLCAPKAETREMFEQIMKKYHQ
jgi:pyruvate-formate lyase-activating enzyme